MRASSGATIVAAGLVGLAVSGVLVAPAVAGSFSVGGTPFGSVSFERPSIGGGARGGGSGGGSSGGGSSAADRAAAAAERARQREEAFRHRLAQANEASDRLQAARSQGIVAAFNTALGQARREAASPQHPGGRSICFDEGRCVPLPGDGAVHVADVVAAYQHRDRMFSEEAKRKHPEIVGWERDRAAARVEIANLQHELDALEANPAANAMEIYKRKDERSRMENKAAWDTYRLEQFVLVD